MLEIRDIVTWQAPTLLNEVELTSGTLQLEPTLIRSNSASRSALVNVSTFNILTAAGAGSSLSVTWCWRDLFQGSVVSDE